MAKKEENAKKTENTKKLHGDEHSREAAQAKFKERLSEMLSLAKKKKNMLEYQEISDFFADLHGVSTEEKNARREELFARFGIDKFAEVKVGNLSTGMKQKVSLVISIVHDPDFIIFDEPTNGLDVITAKVVTDFLQELKDDGKTVILSTHIFSLVEKLCDRVGIIIDGKLIALDSLKNLTAEKNLEEVFFELYNANVAENL